MEQPNILVVDDSMSNLLLLKDILTGYNFNVRAESDGENVHGILKEGNTDLVLLDIMMPRVDGFEVCRRIKADPETRDIPVIFLTAKVDESSLLNGFELGGVDYIKKPFLISELMARVKTHLQLHRAELLLQQSEIKYRTLFNQNTDAVFVCDPTPEGSLLISEVNDTAIKMLGYSREEILDASPEKLFEPVFAAEAVKRINDTAEGNSHTFETYMLSKDQTVIPVEIHAGWFECAGRSSIMCVVRDITERKDINKQILNTVVETEEKERTRFAKDVHDGLGAFFSSLNTYLSLLSHGKISDDELPSVYLEMKELIAEAVEEAKSISNNLMPDMLSNFGLVASVKNLCRKIAPGGMPQIIFEAQEGFVEPADDNCKTAVFRIVNELLNNALKHSQASKVIIVFSNQDSYLRIEYCDNGIGFDTDEVKHRIKDKPYSGITNIYGRVRSLNGKVEVVSSPGNGVKMDIIVDTKI